MKIKEWHIKFKVKTVEDSLTKKTADTNFQLSNCVVKMVGHSVVHCVMCFNANRVGPFFANITHCDLLVIVTETKPPPPTPKKGTIHDRLLTDHGKKGKFRGIFRVKFAGKKALFRGKTAGFSGHAEKRSVKNG